MLARIVMVSMLDIDNVLPLSFHAMSFHLHLFCMGHMDISFAILHFVTHHMYKFWYIVSHFAFLHSNQCQSHWDGEIDEMNMLVK